MSSPSDARQLDDPGSATTVPTVRTTTIPRLWAYLRTPAGQLRLAWAMALAFIALDMLIVGRHALVRYQAYRADAFDLGNMDQAVWNTLHGHPFRFTNVGLDWHGPPTRLGIHVEPILLLIAPLYLIHSGPETLLILQTVALALGGIPLFLLCLRRLPEAPLVGVAFVAAYLLAPELLGEALWDFHAVALATPLLLLALWALDARRYSWFIAAGVLAALTKEDVVLALVPLGVYLAIWRGKPRLGWGVVALSLAYVGICFGLILPHFSGGAAGGNNYWYRYAWLGASPGAAIVNVLTHPWLPFVGMLGDAVKRGYLVELLRTGGGLGIFAPVAWICGLPELAVNILSTHQEQYSGFYQYNAVMLVFLLGAAVYGAEALYRARNLTPYPLSHGERGGPADESHVAESSTAHAQSLRGRIVAGSARVGAAWRRLLARIPIPSHWVLPLVVVWLLATSLWNLNANGPLLPAFWHAGDSSFSQQAAVDALLARVPPNAVVAATDSLDPHLSDRYTIYLMPDPRSYQANYVAINIRDAVFLVRDADAKMEAAMLASGHYVIVGTAGDVTLLHRIGPPIG
ncbi:MAG TPA: DUF2079 domain-containing protein [Ktedonobacterales bacterium]|nr:DUF2079 domain-containing protein [Ktedonobacterales bacterium]